MEPISLNERLRFWGQRLFDEEREVRKIIHLEDLPAGEERDLRQEVRDVLEKAGRAGGFAEGDRRDLIPRLWLKMAGNRIARERKYRVHKGADALRAYLQTDHGLSLSEASSLSEKQLLWIFGEIDLSSKP